MNDGQEIQYMIGAFSIILGLTMVICMWIMGRKTEPKIPDIPDESSKDDSWVDDGSWQDTYSGK